MSKNKTSKRGPTPPQQGRIVPASKPMDVRGGVPPSEGRSNGGTSEKNVRGGGDPFGGAHFPKGTSMPVGVASAGAAPVGGMSTAAGKSPSDLMQNSMDKGRTGYAKGGKIGEEQTESKKERAAEKKNPALEAAEGSYAKGGKINRFGTEKAAVMPTAAPASPDDGGNGGIPGVASPIPLAQPGGRPSTGVTASGRMEPSWAGADTNGITPDGGGQLRGPAMKRQGARPSLPRPMRRG